MTSWSSSSVMVALSPVVPQGTRRRTPPAIWYSIKSRRHCSSTAPSAAKGVTSAVAQPRNQSTCIVIVHLLSIFDLRFLISDYLTARCSSRRSLNRPPEIGNQQIGNRQSLQYFVHNLSKLKHTSLTHNPVGGEHCATCKSLA